MRLHHFLRASKLILLPFKHKENQAFNERQKRSISKERVIETLVVADSTMKSFYRNEDLETYLLTVMNMVNSLYSRASLKNLIQFAIVRILILENKEV